MVIISVSVGQKLEGGLAGALGFLLKFQPRHWQAGGAALEVAHSHGRGRRPQSSHRGIVTECPHRGGTASPQADDQTERFKWKPLPLLEPNCKRDVLSLLPCSVGHRDSHYYSVEGKDKEHGGQEVRISGGRLKLTYRPSWVPFLRRGEN